MKIIREVWKEIPSEWLFIVFVGGYLFGTLFKQDLNHWKRQIQPLQKFALRSARDQRPQFIKSQSRLHYIEQKERYLAIQNNGTGGEIYFSEETKKRPYSKDAVDFFNLAAWEKRAKTMGNYLPKGSRIIVDNIEFGDSKRQSDDKPKPLDDFDDEPEIDTPF